LLFSTSQDFSNLLFENEDRWTPYLFLKPLG
jgi:hypothetical protein